MEEDFRRSPNYWCIQEVFVTNGKRGLKNRYEMQILVMNGQEELPYHLVKFLNVLS